ncbi:hypothetical protein ACQP1P_13800 [Dactylosporangium sp. CA-052675]|uniref:AfsR/SARP family transcriptional regulator n=1 Tax=Dactylosporangium sp. CA-052675 TaxID=3239927 RepID=UPI003D8C0A62
MTVRIHLLGPPRVEGRPGFRGLKSWAILARIALGERPVTRAELAGELFADADDPLGALRWCLADLRRGLGRPDLFRGDRLALPRDGVWLDVWALRDGVLPVDGIGGVLLAGAEPRQCPRFDAWLLVARGDCAARGAAELRQAALVALAAGDADAATGPAGRAAALDPLDEGAQELFLRVLVAAGQTGQARRRLAQCEETFAREGIRTSPALRAAVRPPAPPAGVRAKAVAAALLRAGTAALDAGSTDAGVETLRRAADEAARSGNPLLHADVLRTLGSALVHAVRGFDGEGAVLLHRAMALARQVDAPALVGDVLRELAFVDLQAGRHVLAERALATATDLARSAGDDALAAGVLAAQGMNRADQGRHAAAADLLSASADLAAGIGQDRQAAWSHGVLARSLLLAGRPGEALAAAERSIALCDRERWNAFRPWPQVLRAECLAGAGDDVAARHEAEEAFALACELGDPCWEGMAGRALALNALRTGDADGAEAWIVDARRRCNRVPDRYVWVCAYVGLAQLEIAAAGGSDLVPVLAERLRADALRADLPEFVCWALLYQAEAGDPAGLGVARELAGTIDNPALHTRLHTVR